MDLSAKLNSLRLFYRFSLSAKKSLICPGLSTSLFCMRICIQPQKTRPVHPIFMIILYWNQAQFHDHLVLDNSPPPKLDGRRYNRAGQIARDVCNHCFPMRSPMNDAAIQAERERLFAEHEALIQRTNEPMRESNGWFRRYRYPVLTAAHTPLFWRYDLDPATNPFFMERLGINAVFNVGAMEWNGNVVLMARVEGMDRKSFLAVAESANGIDGFRFWDYPVVMPETADPETNVYDMRLTAHQDGWIYGLFCAERKDPAAPPGDLSSAVAQCGIARTHDLKTWERLDDLRTPSAQQRNCVLHAEFVGGKYALYTRPQDSFIEAGSGGGIGWGLAAGMEHAVIEDETIMDRREYHTVNEVKNGLGPAPIKTKQGDRKSVV